jgi:hypothetical protein
MRKENIYPPHALTTSHSWITILMSPTLVNATLYLSEKCSDLKENTIFVKKKNSQQKTIH